MLEQIQGASPKNSQGNFLASHYQIAPCHPAGSTNKKGAGRPAWEPTPYAPLTEVPDALPGRYLVRYWSHNGVTWTEVGRVELNLTVPTPGGSPEPAAPSSAQAALPPPPADVLAATVQSALDLAGTGTAMQTGAFGELRALRDNYEAQLALERARNERLSERLETLQARVMEMGDNYVGKVQDLARSYDLSPKAPVDPPGMMVLDKAIAVFKEIAPGINAKLAGITDPAKLLAAGSPIAPPAAGADLAQLAPLLQRSRTLLAALTQVPALPAAALPLLGELCALVQLDFTAPAPAPTPPPPPRASSSPPRTSPASAAAAPPPPPPLDEAAEAEVVQAELVMERPAAPAPPPAPEPITVRAVARSTAEELSR